MIGIARLRAMTGASLRALRHYESLDVPVRKIEEILAPERSPDSRAQALRLAIEVVSAKLTRRLEDLREAIAQLEGPRRRSRVAVVEPRKPALMALCLNRAWRVARGSRAASTPNSKKVGHHG